MTEPDQAQDFAKRAERVGRAALSPVTKRIDMVRSDLGILRAEQARVSASLEQVSAATVRLDAYFDRFREELRAEFGSVIVDGETTRAHVAELVAERIADRQRVDRQIGDLRGSARQTELLLEQAASNPGGLPQPAPTEQAGQPPSQKFDHPVPTFDHLYRAFEDRHRGDSDQITEQQGEDYLDLLRGLPNEHLPVADLGCGRGELVRLLDADGIGAIGIDSNHGQIADGEDRLFIEMDLFQWLDAQADSSHRAIVSMHVVEHLPLPLQVRLIFEARRVLAEGGALILETPNALSISTAATNFWVDPTHQRPVHPAFLEFLADEAGFSQIELLPLHQLPVSFRGSDANPELVEDLNSLILGKGDLALIAHR